MSLPDILTEIPESWQPEWVRLPRAYIFDEVRLTPAPGSAGPHLRLATYCRYKTSGLSGDEWRTNVMWEQSPDGKGLFEPYDGPYADIPTGLKAFFPGIFGSHPDWAQEPYEGIDFCWKGKPLYRSTYGRQRAALLVQAGHAPWAEVLASEAVTVPAGWETKCFQPGCTKDATAVVMLKQTFTREGVAGRSWLQYPKVLRVQSRAFCATHRRRGDCGREDADSNYLHVSGTPLEVARGHELFESPAALAVVADAG